MRGSNDGDNLEPKDLLSLGVVDLDLSISPDAFGLRVGVVAIFDCEATPEKTLKYMHYTQHPQTSGQQRLVSICPLL